MEPKFAPLRGADALAAQQSADPLARAAAASLELFAEAGLARLRSKSVALTAGCSTLLDAELGRPRADLDAARRGAARLPTRAAVRPAAAQRRTFAKRLRAAGVVADWRPPDVLRLAPVPLYNRYEDVHAAVRALKRTLDA